MEILNLIGYDPISPLELFAIFTGLTLIIIFIIISLRPKNNKFSAENQIESSQLISETDIFGQEKKVIRDIENYKPIGGKFNWSAVLLVVLLGFGLFLFYSESPIYKRIGREENETFIKNYKLDYNIDYDLDYNNNSDFVYFYSNTWIKEDTRKDDKNK